MNILEKLEELRHLTARYGLPPDRPCIPLGVPPADALLGGGLKPGGLHEIFAADWGAGGFALCLAIRAMGKKPLFLVRTDYAALEYGALSGLGFLELGGDPARLFLVSAANAEGALSATADIVSCSSVGAVVLELEGKTPLLDLKISRRLNFLAEESGVTLFLLREGFFPCPELLSARNSGPASGSEAGGHNKPKTASHFSWNCSSAAITRWEVQSAPSRAGEDWGSPRFLARLTRNRLGLLGEWIVEWNRHGIFQQEPAHSGFVVPPPSHRPDPASKARAG